MSLIYLYNIGNKIMKFSIIIINYNTKAITKDCIESIFVNCSGDYEVILVDNNSDDGSVAYLHKLFKDKIKLIENETNLGFAKANNIGAKEAEGDYLFFLNSDTILYDNILKYFNSFINQQSNLGIVAPKLVLEDGTKQRRAYGDFPNIFNTIFNKFKEEKNIKEKIFQVDWVSGAAFVIKKNIFKKINGFDEKFFMYFEDIDLAKRVKSLGFKVVVNKNIVVTHLGGKSISKSGIRKKYYYNSQAYYFKKHYGIMTMIFMKIIRLPFRLIKQLLT